MYIEPGTPQEVLSIMANLKNTSCGWDEIRQEVMKKVDIVITLTHVLKLSLCNEIMPDETKTACVVPIFKEVICSNLIIVDQCLLYRCSLRYWKNVCSVE